jgi:hypothetical protein
MAGSIRTGTLEITPDILKLIAEIDEFKGAWAAIGRISPDRLNSLRRVATIESIGSSTRIEGAKLSDREVERLLAGLDAKAFASRDEEEVAGYARRRHGNDFHALGRDSAYRKPHQAAASRPAAVLAKRRAAPG